MDDKHKDPEDRNAGSVEVKGGHTKINVVFVLIICLVCLAVFGVVMTGLFVWQVTQNKGPDPSITTARTTTARITTANTFTPNQEQETTSPPEIVPETTTAVPECTGICRTIIFVEKATNIGENLFIRGGISDDVRYDECNLAACHGLVQPIACPCAMQIQHNEMGTGSGFDAINAWRVGDVTLHWYGAEDGQGQYNSEPADGTPLVWTTNEQTNGNYMEDNQWGEHYWKVDLMMNCTRTWDGWFEFKARLNDEYENDISQDAVCGGTAGGAKPYSIFNHQGRCGYTTMVKWEQDECTINYNLEP